LERATRLPGPGMPAINRLNDHAICASLQTDTPHQSENCEPAANLHANLRSVARAHSTAGFVALRHWRIAKTGTAICALATIALQAPGESLDRRRKAGGGFAQSVIHKKSAVIHQTTKTILFYFSNNRIKCIF
jgi:hypothetical protein